MRNAKLGLLVSSALVICGASAGIAHAQVDEIVVTAQKRTSTLQDTPIAMSALSAAVIEDAQISDVQDMQALIPSLNIPQEEAPAQTTIRLRGLGTAGDNRGLEPSVGVFIDGVYRSRVGSALNDFIAVERVEVLRGPQSTIYGKNTPAGVISVLSMKPEYEFGADAEVTIGNYNQRILKGSVTAPVGDSESVAFRLSAVRNTRDGFITNTNDGTKVNNRDRFGLRGQLLIEPRDDISIRLIADYNQVDENCCASPFVFHLPTNAGAMEYLGAKLLPATPFEREVNFEGDLLTDNETSGVSAQVTKTFENFDVTSITAYRTFSETSDIDADFIDIALVDSRQLTDDFNTFTQELRITSTGDNTVDWMAGGYYFSQNLFAGNVTTFGDSIRPFADLATEGLITGLEGIYGLTRGMAPGTFLAAGTGLDAGFDQDSESYAAFGTLDWHVNDKLTLSGGLRYTNEDKKVDSRIGNDRFSQVSLDDPEVGFLIGGIVGQELQGIALAQQADPSSPFFQLPTSVIIDNLPQGVLDQVQAGVSGAVAVGITSFQFFPSGSPAFSESRSEDNVSGNITLAYDWSDNVNLYGKYSRGYKAGGFNLSNRSRAGSGSFEKETIDAYEIGLKARLLDNKVRLNVALFDQTLHDQQVAIFNGSTFDLNNAGDVSVKGAEWDLQAAPNDNLSLMFSGAYLDAKYDSFERGPCTIAEQSTIGHDCQVFGFQDFAGRNLDNVAKWNISTSAKYTIPLGEYESYLRGEAQYRSAFDAKADLDAFGRQPSTLLIGASVGIGDADGRWDLSAWGRNLTNEEVLQVVFNSVAQPGSFSGFTNDPTTYGITLRIHR